MRADPSGSDHAWLDGDAGPVFRPYTVTRGRVVPVTGGFDLLAYVVANVGPTMPSSTLQPEHHAILALVRRPLTVAEIGSRLDLAVGVVRVLLGDLLADRLIAIHRPQPSTDAPSERILREVIDGLRAL